MTNRPLLALSLAGCLAFGALVCTELTSNGGEDAALPEAAPRANVTPVAHRQPTARADRLLETALARPLFSSTRRPPQTATDNGAEGTDLSDKRLTGIIISPGHHIAIFAVKEARPLVLAEGETVSGWRIETIGPTEISLSGPGGNRTLRPKPDPTLLAQSPSTMPAAAGAQLAVPPGAANMPGPRLPRALQAGPRR